MQTAKAESRRTTHHGVASTQMSIQQYVELVDRLLDDQQFTAELKKPVQSQR